MPRGWKSSLLRARRAQEDLARERLARDHAHARAMARSVDAHEQRVTELLDEKLTGGIDELIVRAERRARAASTLAGARQAYAVAGDQIAVGAVAVTMAAQARRTAEKMIEREAVELAREEARVAQRELDELGSRSGRWVS
jgi:hypothetical protein